MTERQTGMRRLLGIRDFRWLYLGQIVSDFGDSLTFVSLLLLVQRLGGSELQIAFIVIAATLPALVIGLIAGVYVDRWDRRRTMMISDGIRAVLVLGFVFIDSLALLWVALVLTFVQAAIGTLFNPARSALIADVVPADLLLKANSVSQTSRVGFNLMGTAAAGILVAVADTVWPAFVIDALTFATSVALVSRIAFGGAPRTTEDAAIWDDLRNGLKVLAASRGMRGLVLGAGVALLGLGAVNVLFVPFIVDELGASEAWLGGIEAAQVVGMLLAGAAVAVVAARLRVNMLISAGLLIIGVAIASVGIVNAPWQMMVVVFVAGLGLTPVQSAAATLVQTLVEPDQIGRSSAALNSVISASSVLSMGLAGAFATALGMRTVFIIAGAITTISAAVTYLLLRGVVTPTAEEQVGGAAAVEAPA